MVSKLVPKMTQSFRFIGFRVTMTFGFVDRDSVEDKSSFEELLRTIRKILTHESTTHDLVFNSMF